MKCLTCEKELDKGRIKYCSFKCQRSSQEFKEKRRIYFNSWVAKNRERYNSLVRVNQKVYEKKKYYELKAKGLCPMCNLITDGKVLCSKCKGKLRVRYQKRKELSKVNISNTNGIQNIQQV